MRAGRTENETLRSKLKLPTGTKVHVRGNPRLLPRKQTYLYTHANLPLPPGTESNEVRTLMGSILRYSQYGLLVGSSCVIDCRVCHLLLNGWGQWLWHQGTRRHRWKLEGAAARAYRRRWLHRCFFLWKNHHVIRSFALWKNRHYRDFTTQEIVQMVKKIVRQRSAAEREDAAASSADVAASSAEAVRCGAQP